MTTAITVFQSVFSYNKRRSDRNLFEYLSKASNENRDILFLEGFFVTYKYMYLPCLFSVIVGRVQKTFRGKDNANNAYKVKIRNVFKVSQ